MSPTNHTPRTAVIRMEGGRVGPRIEIQECEMTPAHPWRETSAGKSQRGRGRRGGRAARGRGRMRKCGVSGGGTWRKVSPHEGQKSLRTMSARTQWPRASQFGLMHCTVEPGMNCIDDSSRLVLPQGESPMILISPAGAGAPAPKEWSQGRQLDGADFAAGSLWCQEKNIQYLVVWLRSRKTVQEVGVSHHSCTRKEWCAGLAAVRRREKWRM
jgi:hypothetical protein